MKQIVVIILVLIIFYLVHSISVEYFQGLGMPLFDIKSYIEKTECGPYEKHSVNCYKTVLKKYREEFRRGILETFSNLIIKDEIDKIKPNGNECYLNLNNFQSGIVGNMVDFTKNIDDNNNKIRKMISNSKFFKKEEVGFIQIYKVIQGNIKKYNKKDITITKIPEIEDTYTPDKDDCEIPNYLTSDSDVDRYIRNNIGKHFVGKITRLLDMIDTDTTKGTIEMYDVGELETALMGAVIETADMKQYSDRTLESLGVIYRVSSKYYCSKYVACCHKENCESIKGRIKESKDKRMVVLYEEKYRTCVIKNKNLRRQTYIKQSNLCKKIDLK